MAHLALFIEEALVEDGQLGVRVIHRSTTLCTSTTSSHQQSDLPTMGVLDKMGTVVSTMGTEAEV
jgi:hypothetical protein